MTRQSVAKPITARARLPLPSAGSGLGPTSWVVLGIVCCAAFVAYSLGWSEAPLSNPDTSSYLQVAQDFSASGHFVQLHERTPGLPLFVLLTASFFEKRALGRHFTTFHAATSRGAIAFLSAGNQTAGCLASILRGPLKSREAPTPVQKIPQETPGAS
jgi:hypothetical protein